MDSTRSEHTPIHQNRRSFLRSSIGIGVWKSGVFGVLDVAVPLGFAFQGVASKLCFRDKSELKWRSQNAAPAQ